MFTKPKPIESYNETEIKELLATSTATQYGLPVVSTGRGDYMFAHSAAEARKACKECIEDDPTFLDAEFIANVTKLPKEAIKPLCRLEEKGAEGVLALVKHTCGIDCLVTCAITAYHYAGILSRVGCGEHQLAGGWRAYEC